MNYFVLVGWILVSLGLWFTFWPFALIWLGVCSMAVGGAREKRRGALRSREALRRVGLQRQAKPRKSAAETVQ